MDNLWSCRIGSLSDGETPLVVRYPVAFFRWDQICLGLNANEIQTPYDKHHKVSSLVKIHQNTQKSVKYEVV